MTYQAAHPEVYFLGAFAITVAAAAITDIKYRLIPNTLSMIIAALWVPYALFMTGEMLYPFITALVILVLAFAAFAAGWIGGGDAKLLAVCALWMGPDQIAPFLFQTAMAGGALALLWRFEAPVRLALARSGMDVDVAVTRELPYGLAIAAGALLAAARMAGLS